MAPFRDDHQYVFDADPVLNLYSSLNLDSFDVIIPASFTLPEYEETIKNRDWNGYIP